MSPAPSPTQPYADSDGYVYGRWGSPTNEGAARQLAALEGIGPEDDGGCMLFSSGMAAISGSLMASLKSGDHAIFPYTVYGGTNEFLREFLQHLGVTWTLVDSTNPQNYADALQPNTRVVYTESPANPTCRLTDLDAVGQIAIDWAAKTGNKKPWVMCDSTFATPFHQRCLETPGVDVAIHSATKYIGGHSDILAGAVTSSSAEFMHECAKVVKLLGAPLAPLESFLLARGLRTLHVRMERHGENALLAAQLLDDHPLVESTFYPVRRGRARAVHSPAHNTPTTRREAMKTHSPLSRASSAQGLPSHPDYELAKKVFTSGGPNSNARQQTFGGMLAFIVKGDPDTALRRAQRMCERLELMTLAVSLGGAPRRSNTPPPPRPCTTTTRRLSSPGTESLIEHPASMTHAMIPRSDRLAGGLQARYRPAHDPRRTHTTPRAVFPFPGRPRARLDRPRVYPGHPEGPQAGARRLRRRQVSP